MNDPLSMLRCRALADETLRAEILATRSSAEPLAALCTVSEAHGMPLRPEDIIAYGEELSCLQMKSTNGGNPLPCDCYDDAYEMLLISLSR